MSAYADALAYVLSFTDFERHPTIGYTGQTPDLGRMYALLDRLGNLQLAAVTLHIAGTKGKGSTAALAAAALHAAGVPVGLFTSPHLHSFRERIRLDGALIGEDAFAAGIAALRPHVEAVNRDGRHGKLTTFEVLTALAFWQFRQAGVAVQVLETGLGGRLDSTNVVPREVCALTPISYDHTAVLGKTLALIAGEKAGIIKPGCIVVSAAQPVEALEVIEAACARNGAPLQLIGRDVTWTAGTASLAGQTCTVITPRARYDLRLPLLGQHQVENAALAVAALEALPALGGPLVAPEAVARGLAAVDWPGRFQVLARRPWLVVDGAHNGESSRRLRQTLAQFFPGQPVIPIVGTSGGHDHGAIVSELASLAQRVIVVRSRHPRATDPALLATEFARHGVAATPAADLPAALALAQAWAQSDAVILVTGSLYVVAEAIEAVHQTAVVRDPAVAAVPRG